METGSLVNSSVPSFVHLQESDLLLLKESVSSKFPTFLKSATVSGVAPLVGWCVVLVTMRSGKEWAGRGGRGLNQWGRG